MSATLLGPLKIKGQTLRSSFPCGSFHPAGAGTARAQHVTGQGPQEILSQEPINPRVVLCVHVLVCSRVRACVHTRVRECAEVCACVLVEPDGRSNATVVIVMTVTATVLEPLQPHICLVL